jgi:hypothetical protein
LLFSDIFKVHVHLFHPEELLLSCYSDFSDNSYSLYIVNLEGHFIPLIPAVKPKRMSFTPSLGLVSAGGTEITLSSYELRVCPNEVECNVVGSFVPPAIKGHRVHRYTFKSTGLLYLVYPSRRQKWDEIPLKPDEALYVFHEQNCLTSATRQAKTNPYFYVPVLEECRLFIVVASSVEEASKAVMIEGK